MSTGDPVADHPAVSTRPSPDHPGGVGVTTPTPPTPHARRPLAHVVGYFCCASWSWLVVFLVVWAVLPLVLQMHPLVIESDSMRPALDRGDLVVVQAVSADDAAVPGRILSFDDPGVEGRVTTHRVDAVDDDGTIWTRGDANPERDSMPVTSEDVRGMARFVVPLVGLPKLWLSEGDWLRSVAVLAVTFVTLTVALTVDPFARRARRSGLRPGWRRRLRRRTTRVGLGTGLVRLAVAGATSTIMTPTAAAFAGATASASTFTTGDFAYEAIVAQSNPAFRWRLGDDPGTSLVFTEDFESGVPWDDYGSGSLAPSTLQAHTGLAGGLKSGRNERNGGVRPLGFATEDDWELEAWVYRPSESRGRSTELIALTDSSYDGYGVAVDHGGTLTIERRDGGGSRDLASVAAPMPEDEWFRVGLSRSGSSLVASVHGVGGTQLATTTAVDTTHGGADRLVVHGRNEFFVDDLRVTARVGATTIASDAMGRLDGSYVGATQLGQPSLLSPAADTAVAFGPAGRVLLGDHPELNIGSRTERSVELWFRADSTTGRQVLYEEGGSTNGLLVYLDGATLRARVWSRTTSWTNDLDASTSIGAGGIHHVVVTLDTLTQPNLVLYVDGAAVADATKGDTSPWAGHSDDGALAGIQGSTRFHDGTSSNAGSTGFTGTLDEVAVYNGVLSDRQVLRHWAAGT